MILQVFSLAQQSKPQIMFRSIFIFDESLTWMKKPNFLSAHQGSCINNHNSFQHASPARPNPPYSGTVILLGFFPIRPFWTSSHRWCLASSASDKHYWLENCIDKFRKRCRGCNHVSNEGSHTQICDLNSWESLHVLELFVGLASSVFQRVQQLREKSSPTPPRLARQDYCLFPPACLLRISNSEFSAKEAAEHWWTCFTFKTHCQHVYFTKTNRYAIGTSHSRSSGFGPAGSCLTMSSICIVGLEHRHHGYI